MKALQYLASFAILALVVSVPAFAKDSNSGNFTLTDHVRVGSTALAPGNYKVQWSGPANNVKVEIMRHGKTVATTQGTIKNLPARSEQSAVVVKTLPDNTKALDQIEFNNRTQELVIAGE
jgi:flagellar basal body P-ring protein FlgI